ncbi:MAG: NYN domain-containing protein [Anaerolineales bacterium]|nr:NYN domain-containing protein [Anaerolineales bacterium]
MNEEKSQKILAVLIDADNTSPKIVDRLFTEIAKYGVVMAKRIYGDWTSPQLKGWKEVLLDYAIIPIQQFSYTRGKNATDSALIIDAMDLLYSDRFDGFCIVASDSDYTRLASRIREQGLFVYGFGDRKTPSPLVTACDRFIYSEILVEAEEGEPSKVVEGKSLRSDTKLVTLLRDAVDSNADEQGWSYLGAVGQHISNVSPSFDSRNYGYQKLGELIAAVGLFEVDNRPVEGKPGNKTIYIRHKPRRSRSKRSVSTSTPK